VAHLRSAIATLPEKQREAVILRDLYGLHYGEICLALGLSRPSVEALLFRARRTLRVRLKPVGGVALVVPLAVREGLAQAVPWFAQGTVAGGACAAVGGGLLGKLGGAAVVKLAVGAVAVGVTGSAVVELDRAGPPRSVSSALQEPQSGDPGPAWGAPPPAGATTQLISGSGDPAHQPSVSANDRSVTQAAVRQAGARQTGEPARALGQRSVVERPAANPVPSLTGPRDAPASRPPAAKAQPTIVRAPTPRPATRKPATQKTGGAVIEQAPRLSDPRAPAPTRGDVTTPTSALLQPAAATPTRSDPTSTSTR
jgi:hypothetical protein